MTPGAERIGMIWAEAANGVIGAGGAMPWDLPEDLAHFQRMTKGHPVIMGRTTWDSLPEWFQPLSGRTNIVITRDQGLHAELRDDGALPVSTIDEALQAARSSNGAEEIWVIGGGQIYAMFLDLAQIVIKTVIDATPTGDTTAPVLDAAWTQETEVNGPGWLIAASGTRYRIEKWGRVRPT
jgi:dihydrofolate reductase